MNVTKNTTNLGCLFLLLSAGQQASAQVVITSKDMFNQIGQYYKAYANKGDVGVGDRLGNASTTTAQSWDFRTGPTDDTYQFDYVAVSDEGHGQDFPNAKFAERKTTQSDGAKAWLYLEQVAGVGRKTYGFYDPSFSSTKPSTPFSSPIVDFPDTMRMGQTWTTATTFNTEISVSDSGGGGLPPDLSLESVKPSEEDPDPSDFVIPAIIHYSSSATVDAFGVLNLPNLSFDDCIRVNELVQYDIEVDLFGDGNYQNVETDYIRNYYWLRPGRGIAAQISSKQQTSPPADNFSTAAAFVRMFETNHDQPQGQTNEPVGIKDLRITFDPQKGKALLEWAKYSDTANYKVEYSTNPSKNDSWTEVTTTKSTFVTDSNLVGVPTRFYRVVTVSQ